MTSALLSTTVRRLAAGAATASLVGLAACTTPPAPTPAPAATTEAPSSAPPTSEAPSPSPSASPSETPSPSASPSQSPSADPDQINAAMLAAGSTARRAVDGSTLVSIEAERSGWEIELVTDDGGEEQARTNQAGTDITSGPTSLRTDADDRAENRRLRNPDVNYREAARIVLREVNGGQLRELNLDEDDGNLRWEADVLDGNQRRTVEIDAGNGRVLNNELDD